MIKIEYPGFLFLFSNLVVISVYFVERPFLKVFAPNSSLTSTIAFLIPFFPTKSFKAFLINIISCTSEPCFLIRLSESTMSEAWVKASSRIFLRSEIRFNSFKRVISTSVEERQSSSSFWRVRVHIRGAFEAEMLGIRSFEGMRQIVMDWFQAALCASLAFWTRSSEPLRLEF